MLRVFAEFETNLRRERQLEGIAAAKTRGVYRGRKPSIDTALVRHLSIEEGLGAYRNCQTPWHRSRIGLPGSCRLKPKSV